MKIILSTHLSLSTASFGSLYTFSHSLSDALIQPRTFLDGALSELPFTLNFRSVFRIRGSYVTKNVRFRPLPIPIRTSNAVRQGVIQCARGAFTCSSVQAICLFGFARMFTKHVPRTAACTIIRTIY